MTWVDEARVCPRVILLLVKQANLPIQATYELDSGNIYAAYELYLSAHAYNAAHDIAVVDLAPDAVIRKDLELLCRIFQVFDSDGKRDKITGWFVKGKVNNHQTFITFAPIC